MENARNDNGTISPEEVKKLEDAIKQKQIGAVRIYDGALSEDFCNELIEVFDKNSDNHFQWTIDPIDGTRAFVIGAPTWSNLIGLSFNKKSKSHKI